MIVAVTQRWSAGRDAYRPAGEPLRPAEYEVATIDRDGPARAFVVAHHYSGSYPAARERFGLYHRDELVGVAVCSVPMHPHVLGALPEAASGVELGRFVLVDSVPANGESWFLARCFALLRRDGYTGVVADSDPQPRRTASGDVVFPGHIGTIYQATNAAYLGRTARRTRRLFADGRVLVQRALSKALGGERGAGRTEQLLLAAGAAPRADGEELRPWCRFWVQALTRPVRHPGNHRYAWRLDRGRRLSSHPYPKVDLFGAA